MDTVSHWQVTLDFAPDFPMVRGGLYLRIINECWRQLTHLHPQVVCMPLVIRSDGVCGTITSTSVQHAAAALDTFRHKTTDHIRRLSGKRDVVIWEYVQFKAISLPEHQPSRRY